MAREMAPAGSSATTTPRKPRHHAGPLRAAGSLAHEDAREQRGDERRREGERIGLRHGECVSDRVMSTVVMEGTSPHQEKARLRGAQRLRRVGAITASSTTT